MPLLFSGQSKNTISRLGFLFFLFFLFLHFLPFSGSMPCTIAVIIYIAINKTSKYPPISPINLYRQSLQSRRQSSSIYNLAILRSPLDTILGYCSALTLTNRWFLPFLVFLFSVDILAYFRLPAEGGTRQDQGPFRHLEAGRRHGLSIARVVPRKGG